MPDCFDLDIGNVTYSGWNADGYLEVSWDSYGTEGDPNEAQDASSNPYEAHHPLGLLSRPLDPVILQGQGDPDPTQSCNVLIGMEGGRGWAIPLEDTRLMPLLPQVQKGESLMYGPAWGQFCRLAADGSIALYTQSKSVYQGTAVGAAAMPVVFNISPDGQLDFKSQYGKIHFGPEGFHVTCATGGRLGLGGISGLPGPLAKLSSYFKVQAALVNHDASLNAIGASGAVPDQVVKLTPLITMLKAMMSSAASAASPDTAPAVVEAVNQALDAAAAVLGTQTLVG